MSEGIRIQVADIDISKTNIDLKRTRWTGNTHTRNSHLHKLINQAGLPTVSDVQDVGKLIQYKMQLKEVLMASGLFKIVNIQSQAYAENSEQAADGNQVELLISVVEGSRTTGQIGTEVDPNNVGRIEGKFELDFNNWKGGK